MMTFLSYEGAYTRQMQFIECEVKRLMIYCAFLDIFQSDLVSCAVAYKVV